MKRRAGKLAPNLISTSRLANPEAANFSSLFPPLNHGFGGNWVVWRA
jgi:hypothetical protein